MIPIVLAFAKKYWKEALVVVVIGAMVVGVGTLYARYKVAKADVILLKAKLEVCEQDLASVIEVNEQWQSQADSWATHVAKMEEEAANYQSKLAEERARRLAAIARLKDLEAEVSSQITSEDCDEAVGQFIGALGWGTP